jgi:hypothetical protein
VARLADTTAHLTPTHVLMRFGVRTTIPAVFASFGTIGFGRSLAALLWMTIILCAVIAAFRRERVFTAGLNHWDEMVATTALYCAVTEINRLSAF